MPKKSKKELTEEERSKMLEKLAEMRNTVAKNRELKKQNATATASTTETKSKNPIVFKDEIDIKKKPVLAEETHAKLDKIALHLEELTTLKKDKIKTKREKEEKEIKEKQEKEIKEKEVKEVKEVKEEKEIKNVVIAEPPKQIKPVNIVLPTASAYVPPTFKLPSSMGNPFFSGGRF
jgi:hypothetical protein